MRKITDSILFKEKRSNLQNQGFTFHEVEPGKWRAKYMGDFAHRGTYNSELEVIEAMMKSRISA